MKRILKGVWFVLIILGIFLTVKTLDAFKALRVPSSAYDTISVSGDGEVFAIPDLATFSFGVSSDAKTVTEAQSSVTKKMDAILAGLKDLGIEEKDIKTTDYSVYPKYTYASSVCSPGYCPPATQKQDGYTANHSVSVKVRKTDDAGKALATAGDKGATNLSSISFTVDDPNKITEEARAKAIEDAKAKAKILAKELGVTLVRIVSFTDGSDAGAPVPYYRTLGMDAGTAMSKAPTLPTGENKVSLTVSVVYEIR